MLNNESQQLVSGRKEPSRGAKIAAYATIGFLFLGFAAFATYNLTAPQPEPLAPGWSTRPAPVVPLASTFTSSVGSSISCPRIETGIHSIEIGGRKREFEVYRPAGLPDDTKAPLVLVIHGLSSSPSDIEKKVAYTSIISAQNNYSTFPL